MLVQTNVQDELITNNCLGELSMAVMFSTPDPNDEGTNETENEGEDAKPSGDLPEQESE